MHRWIRRLLIAALLCALLGAATLGAANWLVIHTASPWIYSPEEVEGLDADCILVLGAGLWAPGEASPMLADRLEMAMVLYDLGAGEKLLMSGDHGTADYNEVEVMRNWALEAGAPAEDIFMDHAGFSTYESMVRAAEVFQCRRVVIVTQRYHLYRAVYIARSLGLDACGVAAEEIVYPNALWRESREVLARAKDVLYCLFRPAPTFLGDAIPISGPGTASWDDTSAVFSAGGGQ